MKVFRRTLAAVVVSGTALGGVAVVGVSAAQAAATVPTRLAIKAPHAVTYATAPTVMGKLTLARRHHGAVGNVPVTLEERARPRAHWMPDGTGTTAANGTVTITAMNPQTRTEQFRLVYAGDKTGTPATRGSKSAVKTVKVRYAVTATPSGAAAPATVAVTVAPSARKATLLLQKKVRKGWRTVGHTKLDKAGTSATFPVKKAGTYRVVKPASHRLLKGVSAPFSLS